MWAVRRVRGAGIRDDEQRRDVERQRLHRARERYEPGAKFSTWLFTIANNVASNALRSRSRRREVGVPEGNGSDSSALQLDQLAKAASGFMPTRALDKAEQAEMVRHAVSSLSERQRMALLLAKFEGMSYQDIAQSMDLSVQAIKSLLSRARVVDRPRDHFLAHAALALDQHRNLRRGDLAQSCELALPSRHQRRGARWSIAGRQLE